MLILAQDPVVAHVALAFGVPFALGNAVGRRDAMRKAARLPCVHGVRMPTSHAAAAAAAERPAGDLPEPQLTDVAVVIRQAVHDGAHGAAPGVEGVLEVEHGQVGQGVFVVGHVAARVSRYDGKERSTRTPNLNFARKT